MRKSNSFLGSRPANLSADAEARLNPEQADVAKNPIEIECEEVWRHISNYLDGEVDTALQTIMSSHFKHCAHCTAVLDGTRNVVKLVGDGRAFEISSEVSRRFYKKLNDHLAARQHPRE